MFNEKSKSIIIRIEVVVLAVLILYGFTNHFGGSRSSGSLTSFSDNEVTSDSEESSDNEESSDSEASPVSGETQKKIIYLTFDDGPTGYTESVLDLLKEYDIRATFFVTNQNPACQDLIQREYEEGHTIGLHSYSHNYSIYASEDAYYQDLEKMEEIVYAQTGEYPTIVRFPGGSSNSISWNYCTGIMTCLTEGLEQRGYRYCDWNVDSMDAYGYLTAGEIAQTTIKGIMSKDESIVLMHDIGQCNVDAAKIVIEWALENGYTFLPMSEDTKMVHHRIVN